MADFLLRDIDERVADCVKEMARQRGWPLNDVLLHLIKQALGLVDPEPAPVPGDIARLMPLLEGLDGVNKMGKSLGNYIGINEPANTIFGKTMSISDDLMWRWYTLLSFEKSLADIERMAP